MLAHTETELPGWKRVVSTFLERYQGFLEELGREEMILERKELDERIQRAADRHPEPDRAAARRGKRRRIRATTRLDAPRTTRG